MSDPKGGRLTEQQMSSRWTAVPPEMDFEPVPLPDQAAGPGTKDADAPPAQSGPSSRRKVPARTNPCITLARSAEGLRLRPSSVPSLTMRMGVQ